MRAIRTFCDIRGAPVFAAHRVSEAGVDVSSFPFQRFANLAAPNEGDPAAGID